MNQEVSGVFVPWRFLGALGRGLIEVEENWDPVFGIEMIVSALLTSVGINLDLSVLFFALHSVLRKQPGNLKVYTPRLIAEGQSCQRGHFNIEDLLPYAGWVRKACHLFEEDLYNSAGLNGIVFNRIFIFRLRVFVVAAIIGLFILLPVNFLGNQLRQIDFSDLPNKSLDFFYYFKCARWL